MIFENGQKLICFSNDMVNGNFTEGNTYIIEYSLQFSYLPPVEHFIYDDCGELIPFAEVRQFFEVAKNQ